MDGSLVPIANVFQLLVGPRTVAVNHRSRLNRLLNEGLECFSVSMLKMNCPEGSIMSKAILQLRSLISNSETQLFSARVRYRDRTSKRCRREILVRKPHKECRLFLWQITEGFSKSFFLVHTRESIAKTDNRQQQRYRMPLELCIQ